MKLPIENQLSKILRKPSQEVRDFNDPKLKKLIQDMFDTLKATPNGVGLAAPQVGESLRLFIVLLPKFQGVFINPKIEKISGEVLTQEGCLSVPKIWGEIKRAKEVEISAYNEKGKKFKMKSKDLLAQIFQHEIDHLDGILFIDKAEKIFSEKK